LALKRANRFTSNARTTEVLERARVDARAYLEHYFETPGLGMTHYWANRQWQYVALGATTELYDRRGQKVLLEDMERNAELGISLLGLRGMR
jgi:hypothetical protein